MIPQEPPLIREQTIRHGYERPRLHAASQPLRAPGIIAARDPGSISASSRRSSRRRRRQALDRRGVSLRWLGAQHPDGLMRRGLIGGAIYVALEGETDFAELPELVDRPGAAASGRGQGHGGPQGRQARALGRSSRRKQSFRAPVTIRVGDREVIKVRAFVRIATKLSLTSGALRDRRPALQSAAPVLRGHSEKVIAEAAPDDRRTRRSRVVKRDLSAATVEPSAAA